MYQFSEIIVKKVYVTPIVEFEMMEEECGLMGVSGDAPNEEGGGDPDPAKRSDFVFDDNFEYQIDGME